eukprot:760124-Hanusia_phi.AAC.8
MACCDAGEKLPPSEEGSSNRKIYEQAADRENFRAFMAPHMYPMICRQHHTSTNSPEIIPRPLM